jgi:uncharacterized damage-inducible protein DinB
VVGVASAGVAATSPASVAVSVLEGVGSVSRAEGAAVSRASQPTRIHATQAMAARMGGLIPMVAPFESATIALSSPGVGVARPTQAPRRRRRRIESPANQEDAVPERDSFFDIWDREAPKFDSVMDALPTDRLDYRPHPKSRSAAEMVAHLAREQEMLTQMMNEGKIDYRDPVPEDFGEMRALWKKCTSELRDRLKNLDDAGWNRPVKFFMNGKQINETSTHEMLWGFLLDMVHHRGQLSTYIRPMGGKVPSIYGPSADAEPSRPA